MRKVKKFVKRRSSSGLVDREVPQMKGHLRKSKKVPGSVRKPTNDNVTLVQSSIKGRPDCAFFSYPAYVGKQKETSLKVTNKLNLVLLASLHKSATVSFLKYSLILMM